MNRYWKLLLAMLAAFSLVAAACGDDETSTDDTDGGDEPVELTLGAPQDCETNAFCIPGLKRVYGVDLADSFTPLDANLVAGALDEGEIDIAVLFSTDGRIAANEYVLLEDDMQMLAADNVFPVVSDELTTAYGDDFETAVNAVSEALTTEALIEMNKRFDVDKEDADAIAADFVSDEGLDQAGTTDAPDGPEIKIGAQDFGESAILAEIYKQSLEPKGYTVSIQEVGGFRDLLFGALEKGDVNFAPEYVASELEFLNDFAGEATSDVAETLGKLEPLLEAKGLVALDASEAVDTNAFVVTQETSDKYDLTKLSQLKELLGQ
jgi:osmoprotectant transport system substrate-binding protein